ncbi:MAG: response regulator, partial [Ignavibacteriales bacterium]|nr:response regulator [Ignavibacteriales bacterium]
VYLLSADKSAYEQFVLIGTCESAKQSFSADLFEGEFGLALSSRKMQHIKNIPETTRFVFQTVQGNVIPSEIITIPVLAGNEVVAVISLASIKPYSRQALKIIDALQVALGARVTSILAYRKMKSLTETLKEQNSELEIQKTELETQSSELAQQNVALELHKQQLDEANRQKTIFLSNMSHELRTPLNSVIALSGVLNRRLAGTIPDEEHSYLEVIERNGKNLLALINDILDISRIESGRIELDLNVFNGNNLVSEIISMILPQAHQKGIALLHAATVTDIEIHSDPDKCRHILQNLIANAVKFTEAGKVEITTSRVDENFVVSVADTGIGIAEEHLPHIFEEFRQADGSTSRKFGGTGLGLAIAKKYAMLLGGSISAKSTKGAGSEFTLTLPLNCVPGSKNIGVVQKTEIKPALTSQPLVDRNLAAAKTILLVEDSEPAIIQIMDILEESGYKVLVAHDGAEALEIIGQTIPDAMILDLMMPGIDGFAVLSTIREEERTAHIPVLILTAKHISKDELKFLKRNNVYQLIQKGDVNRSELLNTVTAMVFPAHTEPAAPRNRSIIEGRPLILIVEDNPDNMKTAKALLGDKFELLEATDGNAAIQMAK